MSHSSELSNQSKSVATVALSSSYRIDTDVRQFTDTSKRTPFPSKQRTMRLYMPQEAEPLVLMDIERLRIGRARGENRLDLSLQYAKMLGVSREHADIIFHEGSYFVTDLGSTNGTFLNNQKLQANVPTLLEHSDQLRFGHFVTIIGFS